MHRYSLIALVVAAAWLGVPQPGSAQGTIAYYQPPSPIILHDEFFGQFYPLDVDGDSQVDITFGYDFHFIGVRSEGSTRLLILSSPPPNIGGSVAPLPIGFSIGAQSESGSLRWFSGVPWADPATDFDPITIYLNGVVSGPFAGQQAYMGIEFQRASGTHYGWVSLYVNSFAPVAVIDSWAWETQPGVPILAGAVPEPSTWTLLIGGGVLMVWFRGKKNERRG